MASVVKNQGKGATPETPIVVASPGNYGEALGFEGEISEGEDKGAMGIRRPQRPNDCDEKVNRTFACLS